MREPGIEAVNAYLGVATVTTADLFRARGLDDRRMTNLMMRSKTVALPCEDVITYAVNAAAPLLDELGPGGRESVELLIVGTESGVDYSKSTAAWVHGHLGLGRACRLLEVKQACDGGVSALRLALSALRTDHRPGARALVIGADVPWVVRGDYIEPSQGAGAVALLLGDDAKVATVGTVAGVHSFAADDFLRPKPEVYLWDVDLSMLCYIECAKGAMADYARRTGDPGAFQTFDHLAMHTPFPGMVRGAHRALMRTVGRHTAAEVDSDFARRSAPSLVLPAEVGNIYAGTTLLALKSVVDNVPGSARSVGLFSYGSGCSSQVCEVSVTLGARTSGTDPRDRRTLDVATYDALLDASKGLEGGIRHHRSDLPALRELTDVVTRSRPMLVLTEVSDYRRVYSWLEA